MNTTPRHGTQLPPPGRPGEPAGPGESDRRELAALLPPPAVPGLDADRYLRLRAEVLRRAVATAEAPRGATRPPARHRRPLRIVVPVLAGALAIAAAVTVDGTGGAAGRGGVVAGGGAGGASEAVRLLDRIALAAAAVEQPAVRADQFVYVESRVSFAAQSAAGGPATPAPVHTRQVWRSADGTRPGLLREEGGPDTRIDESGPVLHLDGPAATARPGVSERGGAPGGGGPSIGDPTHAFVAALPTDPDALLALIREQTRGQGQDPDQRAFTAIGDLLAETWAPPPVGAALYRAAERIPGVTVVPSAVDAAGREGVAVARTAYGRQTQWLFDRGTYAFLGERTVLGEDGDAGPAGTVVGTSAVIASAAVDRAGDLPPAPPRT
ncbi:CU044_5270 family protein [Kitasatospora sp. NPDC036755]|uniref:CU044_5270 family protein n=1 Tax=Kitasatospora sp. NPDC036755 TaxID=3154600 RepID=UPI0033C1BAB7